MTIKNNPLNLTFKLQYPDGDIEFHWTSISKFLKEFKRLQNLYSQPLTYSIMDIQISDNGHPLS